MSQETDYLKMVGERIRLIRKELQITQQKLEEDTGLNPPTVQRLENGKGGTIPALITILNYFHKKGYNLKWFILDNNSNELKKYNSLVDFQIDKIELKEATQSLEEQIHEVKKHINKINRIINKIT
ncbi:helix-turn-helix protein [Flavobacterium croceum DSM 17960]|uniref:Helix-turn-helix protein n=1 Tax=Flavobacterium croceum DSM 17960 TaxID=1121886 RepID=A0A2S4N5A1_9FLAO|nr:helix-turn-helix transcriptional regulator [Flavobacterium croceum]POS00919.1 helix-turn-helix protein [Flavobacterium croceum DSM 17960]